MKPLAFNRTLRQLVALPILLLLILGSFLVWQIQASSRAQRELDHSDRVTDQLQELQNLFIDQETGLRGFQLTGDPVMLSPWKSAAGPIQSRFGDLQQMLAADPAQMAQLTLLRNRYSPRLAISVSIAACAVPYTRARFKYTSFSFEPVYVPIAAIALCSTCRLSGLGWIALV